MIKVIAIFITTLFCLFFIATNGQTYKNNDIILSADLTNHFSGLYNAGMEYFFTNGRSNKDKHLFSVAINGGKFSTKHLNQQLGGYIFQSEFNLYTDFLLNEKWNEYGGLKLSAGNIKNTSNNRHYSSFFIGLTTGIQPLIAKRMALKIGSDIGYVKNGVTKTLFFNDQSNLLYSGFVINYHIGLGIRL